MHDRMFDKYDNIYRNIASAIDNEATVGDDRLFDNSGKLYRDLDSRMDNEVVDNSGKSYLKVGNEVSVDNDVLIGPEDRTYKALSPNVNVEEDYYSVVGRMKDVYAAKNADYGNSFEMTLDKYGIIGAIIRMQDKMNRIDGYYWKPDDDKKVDESLIDTLEDLGNYAIMTSVWLRNQ